MNFLTKVIFKNSTRQEKTQNSKEKFLSFVALSIVFGFLSISMIVISIAITKKLKEINQEYTFINILLLMNFLILFGKSIFESINVLYFSKDLKILLRMPIKSKDIVSSKIINMIISEYEMEIIMLAIPMSVYGILTNVGIIFYLYMTLILLVLPIIPIMITSCIIATIMRFTNIIKNKTRVMYIAILLTMVIIELLLTGFNTKGSISKDGILSAMKSANGLAEAISNEFILIKPIMHTLQNYGNQNGARNIAIYFIESIAFYMIGIFYISKIYFKGAIGTVINSRKNIRQKELTIKDFKKQDKYKSYMQKEKNVISRTPIFFLQCVIIPIMYPILIFIVFLFTVLITRKIGYDIITYSFQQIVNTSIAQSIFIGAGQVFFMMNFASIIGISKDSRSAIITKSLPVKLEKQFTMKTKIGKKINNLSIALISLCYFYTIRSWKATLIITVILYLINETGERMKLFIDLKKPQINWNNEYTMMKQNSNIMNVLFYTLATLLGLFLLSIIIKDPSIYLAIVLIITIIVHFSISAYIQTNEETIFKKVY